MSHKKCDILREKAMQAGRNSAEAAAWRRHARQCRDCATEIDLLEILQEQADTERLHLPRQSSAMLVAMVRQQYQQRPRPSVWSRIWPYFWKPAVLAALVMALVQVIPPQWSDDPERQAVSRKTEANLDQAAPPAFAVYSEGCYFLPLNHGSQELEKAVLAATSPAEAVCLPEVLPGRGVDRAIRELRRNIEEQSRQLEELIDRDLSVY